MMKVKLMCAAVVAATLAVATSANAAVLMADDFNAYTLGNLVPQDSWVAHSGAGVRPVQVVPSPPCFCSQGEPGNAVQIVQDGSGEDVSKAVGVTMGEGDKWYAGFCVVVDGEGPLTDSDYFAHFKTSGNYFAGKVFASPANEAGNDFTFAFQAAGSGEVPAVYWPTDFSFGTCHRIIASYEYDTGYGEMWVDPDCALGPDGNLKIDDTGYTANALAAYAFRQATHSGVNPIETVDNLVVSTSWAEACCVCVPEPATLALFAIGGLALLRRR